MRVLWLINIPMPDLSVALGEQPDHTAGWIESLLPYMPETEVELTICSPFGGVSRPVCHHINGIDHIAVPYGDVDHYQALFSALLKRIQPEVIHIFGTEQAHARAMIQAADPNRVIVHIQGIIALCAKHYGDGLPARFLKAPWYKKLIQNFCPFLSTNLIETRIKAFEEAGESERYVLQKAHHIIGHSEWDHAYTWQLNPSANYYHWQDGLRDCFWGKQWLYEACEKHTIFFSQAYYPIKGLHQLLKAMPLIRRSFPDACVLVAGMPPPMPKHHAFMDKIYNNMHEYAGYINALIREYQLEDCITFLGSLTGEEMCAQYLKANVFVCSSSVENASNSLGEALLLGVPCVASAVGGMDALMRHNIDGIFYPFEEEFMLAHDICRVFENPEMAKKFSTSSQQCMAQNYDGKQRMKTLLDIYGAVAK